MSLITIVNTGPGLGVLRVNGVEKQSGLTFNDQGFASGTEFFGNRVYYERDNQLGQFLYGVDSLAGGLCGALTVFGDSSGQDLHNEDVTLSEVEHVEGYFAHRYGCALDCLPTTGHPFRDDPPVGPGGGAATGGSEGALGSRYGILMKLNPVGEGSLWAFAGGGIGDCVVTDEEGGVFSTGPQAAPPSYPSSSGPMMRTALKLIDRGVVASFPGFSEGVLRIAGDPATGDAFTINDGNGAQTFEWTAGAPTIPGAIAISNAGTTTYSHAQAAVQVLVSATSVLLDADSVGESWDSVIDVTIMSRRSPNGSDYPIAVTSPGNNLSVVRGMSVVSAWGDDIWAVTEDQSLRPTYRFPRSAVDARGRLYQPLSVSSFLNRVVRRSGETGAIETSVFLGDQGRFYGVHSVAVDGGDEELLPALGPEFVWAATSNIKVGGEVTGTHSTQYRTRWVNSVPNGNKSRKATNLLVAGGDLFEMKVNGDKVLVGDAGQFSPERPSIPAVEMFGDVFLCDSGTYRVVNLATMKVKEWKSETSGQMPDGGQMLAKYRGRIVIARTKRDPHGLYASAHGDPYDWDVSRSLNDPTGAFAGTSTKRNPDLVQALCPFYDDFLIVGGASSITQFSGDLSSNGSIDLFTDATGIAQGNSFALSPSGLLYFFGSRGGVWVMQPGTDGRSNPPVEISEQTVGREMAKIDLSKYQPNLIWDTDRDGLHVIMHYIGQDPVGDERHRHWFYSQDHKAWWPVVFGDDLALPTVTWTQHGDTKDERRTMVGWADGGTRYFDDDASWDDGVAIDSRVLVGPIGDPLREYGLHEVQMGLSRKSGAVRFAVYASDDAEDLGEPIHRGSAQVGFSGSRRAAGRGSSLWIELGSARIEDSWGLSELGVSVSDKGKRRRRK